MEKSKNFVDQQMDMEVYDIYMDDEISGTTFVEVR